MNEITSIEEFNRCYNSSEISFLLKHSTRCPISFGAYSRVKEFSNENDINIDVVLVVENRGLSNHIEDVTSVRHESPQIFVFKNGEVVATTSHGSITKSFLYDYAGI